jgi:hypothetical protein
MNPEQQQAVDKVLALRELSRATGTKTTRAINLVLQSLKDADLIVVAKALHDAGFNGEVLR